MFGIRFMKVAPTFFVLQYKGGKIVREGAGLPFFCFPPTPSLVLEHFTLKYSLFHRRRLDLAKGLTAPRRARLDPCRGRGVTRPSTKNDYTLSENALVPAGSVDVIFSDGMESDVLQSNSGTEAKITLALTKGHLVT